MNIRWTIISVFILCLTVACNSNNSPTTIPLPVTTSTRTDALVSPTSTSTLSPTPLPNTATPKSTATVTPLPTSTQTAAPKVLSFTVVPTTTHTIGEKITATWQAQGTQATLCPFIISPSGPLPQEKDCSIVPLAGTKAITITQASLDWTGMMLRVTSGNNSDFALANLSIGCEGLYNWFFANAPSRCPDAAPISSPAAAQRFERGMMIWLKQPDRFYVFYNENPQVFEWVETPYRFTPGASANNRVGEKPPAGLVEPVSGFGQIWRGEMEGFQNVRQRLGWAKENEYSFNASYQCERPLGASLHLWTCYLSSPNGKVLVIRPDSSAQAHFIWNEQ